MARGGASGVAASRPVPSFAASGEKGDGTNDALNLCRTRPIRGVVMLWMHSERMAAATFNHECPTYSICGIDAGIMTGNKPQLYHHVHVNLRRFKNP